MEGMAEVVVERASLRQSKKNAKAAKSLTEKYIRDMKALGKGEEQFVVISTSCHDKTLNYQSTSTSFEDYIKSKVDYAELESLFYEVIAEQGRLLTLPPKPIRDMDFKPAKIFTQSMMKEFAVLTNRPNCRPGFINPDMRPSWWPTSIPWQDRVLQVGRKKDDFLLIIRACFSYFKVQSHLIGYPVTPPVTEEDLGSTDETQDPSQDELVDEETDHAGEYENEISDPNEIEEHIYEENNEFDPDDFPDSSYEDESGQRYEENLVTNVDTPYETQSDVDGQTLTVLQPMALPQHDGDSNTHTYLAPRQQTSRIQETVETPLSEVHAPESAYLVPPRVHFPRSRASPRVRFPRTRTPYQTRSRRNTVPRD